MLLHRMLHLHLLFHQLFPIGSSFSDWRLWGLLQRTKRWPMSKRECYLQRSGFIDQLPANQRFDAKMKLTGANSFDRNNPLVNAFAGMYGWQC
jgi:hypothetical protein